MMIFLFFHAYLQEYRARYHALPPNCLRADIILYQHTHFGFVTLCDNLFHQMVQTTSTVLPMYIGRLRTGSKPSSTWICAAPYCELPCCSDILSPPSVKPQANFSLWQLLSHVKVAIYCSFTECTSRNRRDDHPVRSDHIRLRRLLSCLLHAPFFRCRF